jgi:predicted ATPase
LTQTSTKWVVITGAPSSGKTSVIEKLEKLGYQVAHEVARAFIKKLMHQNVDVANGRSDITIQNHILSLKQARERHLDPENRIFFDRGLPDSLAYYKLHHLPISDLYKYFYKFRYEAVFFLEPLPLVNDDIRTETLEIAQKLNQLIYQSYIECDYDPIRVPVMSIEERTRYILEKLNTLETDL